MEYVYAALILHESDTEITEEHLTNVIEAAGIDVEESRVKALVAALEDVDIEEALQEPMGPVAAGAPTTGVPEEAETAEAAEADEEAEAEESEEEDEDTTGEGLGSLFG